MQQRGVDHTLGDLSRLYLLWLKSRVKAGRYKPLTYGSVLKPNSAREPEFSGGARICYIGTILSRRNDPILRATVMVRVALQKWGQNLDHLRRLALKAPHSRTRERFLALSLIADGTHNATSWATQFGRHDETVLEWIHTYNTQGPDALIYRRTGGPTPLLRPTKPSGLSKPSTPPNPSTTDCPATVGR